MTLKKVIKFINKQSKESFNLQDDTSVIYINTPRLVKLQVLSLTGHKGTKLQIGGILNQRENFMIVDRLNYKVNNDYLPQQRKVMLAFEQLLSPNGFIFIELDS